MTLGRDKKISLGQILLFIFWPLMSLINSLRYRKSFWAKNIFWLFCAYYGLTFVVSSPNIDAYRYIESFKTLAQNNFSFKEFVTYLFSGETSYVDILNPLISFILSRFTSDGRILLASYGLIFGYFYSRNLWYLFERINLRSSKITVLFIIVFSLIDPIWKIGAFRFATAIQIFLFGVLPLLIEGNKKKIWITFLSVFVHFSFLPVILLIMIFLLVGAKQNLYFIFFLITFFITEIDIDLIRNQFENLPLILRYKVSSYMTVDSYENQIEAISRTNWYIRYYTTILKYISTAFILVLFIKKKYFFDKDSGLKSLWCFTIFFYSFANIVYLLPQGIRFYAIANLLVFFLLSWISSYNNLPVLFKRVRYAVTPLLILIIVVDIRRGFDFTGLLTIFGNPLVALFFNGDIPLISLIK